MHVIRLELQYFQCKSSLINESCVYADLDNHLLGHHKIGIPMTWTKTLAYSLGLSVAFFFYFAYFVADRWSLWAIYEIGPLLKTIKAEYGQPYSRALGHAIAFAVGAFCTAAFIFPLRYAFPSWPKLLASAIVIIAPVMFVTADGTDRSPAGIATLMQPLVGAALAIATLNHAKRRS
jgi:hypothetical protein